MHAELLPGLLTRPTHSPVCALSAGQINCGVRLLRTNLTEEDVAPVKEQLAQGMFDHIPVGVGSQGIIPTNPTNLQAPPPPGPESMFDKFS